VVSIILPRIVTSPVELTFALSADCGARAEYLIHQTYVLAICQA